MEPANTIPPTPSPEAIPATPPAATPPVSPAATTTTATPPAPAAGKKGGGHSTLIAVILLLLIYPIGVIYMFMATNWPKWAKILITLPIILGIIGGIAYAVMSIL